MKKYPNLIVMLTHNDYTVNNAAEIFNECKDTKAEFWGFKEIGLPEQEAKALFNKMKSLGKKTVLEVVAYTEEEGYAGAQKAKEWSCDYLMGTKYSDKINDFCKQNNINYMPFVGDIVDRPSVLKGTPESMIAEAKKAISNGAYGVDLLGYRYVGDAPSLNKQFVAALDAPVCIAGSVNSFDRLDEIKDANPWTFTIGGAFFENKFNGSFAEQINKVIDYMKA